jgi:hypothetical protein
MGCQITDRPDFTILGWGGVEVRGEEGGLDSYLNTMFSFPLQSEFHRDSSWQKYSATCDDLKLR